MNLNLFKTATHVCGSGAAAIKKKHQAGNRDRPFLSTCR